MEWANNAEQTISSWLSLSLIFKTRRLRAAQGPRLYIAIIIFHILHHSLTSPMRATKCPRSSPSNSTVGSNDLGQERLRGESRPCKRQKIHEGARYDHNTHGTWVPVKRPRNSPLNSTAETYDSGDVCEDCSSSPCCKRQKTHERFHMPHHRMPVPRLIAAIRKKKHLAKSKPCIPKLLHSNENSPYPPWPQIPDTAAPGRFAYVNNSSRLTCSASRHLFLISWEWCSNLFSPR
jgi:hypothetical protein